MLYPGIKKHLPPNWQILSVMSNGCDVDVAEATDSTTDYCQKSNWTALKAIAETRPDAVIVAQNIHHSAKTMNEVKDALKARGIKNIIFTGPVPHWTYSLPKIIMRSFWVYTPRRTHQFIDPAVTELNASIKQQFQPEPGVAFLDLQAFFCNPAGCLTYIGDDRRDGLTTFDYGHLSFAASDYLAQNLILDAILNRSKTGAAERN